MVHSNKPFNRIRVILAEKNMRNIDLARNLGVTEATVSRWVNNESQPKTDMFYKIAEVLEVDLPDLIVSIKGK
ncbi:MAG: helix-turn-helix transcriptional regulator [Cytophagales bacterium]|nr:helix-turn-helix transcriptional regulator [Cytophagales bacterium]